MQSLYNRACAIILNMRDARKITLPGLDDLYIVYLMILAVAFAGYLAWGAVMSFIAVVVAVVECFPYFSAVAVLAVGTLTYFTNRDRR